MESTRGGRSGSRSGTLIAILLILVLVAATLVATFTVMQFPGQVTEEADDINSLYDITLALATFVFLGVEALIIWVCFRFRRRSNTDPAQVHGNNKLEFGWTAIPVMTIIVLFVLAAPLVIDLRESEADNADLTINVTGRQWFWEYEYPEEEITIQEIPDYENPEETVPSLVVPVDQLVVLKITSGDVVHSFYVPKFLYKIQAIPGQVNEMHFTAEEIGTYTGQCAQFCGLNHAQMLLVVEVLSQEDYDAWVEEQQAAQEETPTPGPEPSPGPDGGDDDDGGGGTPLEITSTDNEFNTDELRAAAGEITLELVNDGSALHNWAIPDQDVAADLIPGGETTSVTFTISEPGEYDYQCDVHPTEMQGTLIVE